LRGADEIAWCAGYADEVEAALLPSVRPFDLIAGAVLDRQRCRPSGERHARSPGQVLRRTVGRTDLDRRGSLAIGPPQLHFRCIAHADLAALADVDVPDAWVVGDFRGAKCAEASALPGCGRQCDLLRVEASGTAQGLRACRTEHGHNVAAL